MRRTGEEEGAEGRGMLVKIAIANCNLYFEQVRVQCSKVILSYLADKSPILLIYRMESDLSNV